LKSEVHVQRTSRAVVVLATCAAALLTATAATARPAIAVNSYAGHYQGFFASTPTGQIAPFTMDLTATQSRLVYGGVLMSADVRQPFSVAVATDGSFAALGVGASAFVAVGRATGLADGSILATARYAMRTPLGLDNGTLRFLRSFPAGDASRLPGSLSGTCTDSAGARSLLTLRVNAGSAVPGAPDFGGSATLGGLTFPALGSIGNPDFIGNPDLRPVEAIGVSSGGSLDFSGSWVSGGQPHMQGTATLTLGDGSIHVSDCMLLPAVRPGGA
jgi:hypothetical protein